MTTEQQVSTFIALFTREELKSVVMAVKLAWFLGVVVVAALLNSLPIESKCIVQYCDDDEEMVKTLLRIQGSMERQEQQMASMKEELSLLKEEMSLLKDNLTVCCKCFIIIKLNYFL